jgi:hypothetical protein
MSSRVAGSVEPTILASALTDIYRISYKYRMSSSAKRAISVTLDADNITWLKGRAGATGVRSVSELLDQIVRAARKLGRGGPSTSVIGSVDIDPQDPLLTHADAVVRAMVDTSIGRPMMVKEAGSEHRVQRRSPGKRRRG